MTRRSLFTALAAALAWMCGVKAQAAIASAESPEFDWSAALQITDSIPHSVLKYASLWDAIDLITVRVHRMRACAKDEVGRLMATGKYSRIDLTLQHANCYVTDSVLLSLRLLPVLRG